jgi:hypothetical protein
MIPATLKRLITSSVLYMIIAVLGAVLAVLENRPSDPSGVSTGLPVRQDFLYGNGTAMSPALYMLAAQAIFTILAPRRVRWGAFGVGGLTIAGLLFGVGMLVEPILFESLNPATFVLLKALIVIALIIVPLVMMVFGIREWAGRRPDK